MNQHREAFEAHLRSQGFEPRRNGDSYHGNNGHDWLTWKAALAQLGTGSGAGAQSDSGADSGHLTSRSDQPSMEGDTGWRPIDTAPRDGTEVLAWREDCGIFMAKWTCANALRSMTDKERDELDEISLFQEDWFGGDSESNWRLEGSEVPTHWMPVPAGPIVEERAALATVEGKEKTR